MKKILVVGSANMDLVVKVPYMPSVGETILGESFMQSLGGQGANQAFACGRLGEGVAFLAAVGCDAFGKRMLDNMNEIGVDVTQVKEDAAQPTGTAFIYVDAEGRNNIVVVPGANQSCDGEYLKTKRALFEHADFLLIQMEIPYTGIWEAMKYAKELGKTVVLNPAPAPDYGVIQEEAYRCVDYITPNETELAKLSGLPTDSMENVQLAGKRLLSFGVRNVLVTLGEKGAMLINQTGAKLYPSIPAKAVDTTAAGDTFNGAFVVGLAEGKSVDEAVAFANAASSIAVSRKGAQASVPTRNEVENLLKTL